eukprot:350051-Chlamydomonas_euryale.AAC.3
MPGKYGNLLDFPGSRPPRPQWKRPLSAPSPYTSHPVTLHTMSCAHTCRKHTLLLPPHTAGSRPPRPAMQASTQMWDLMLDANTFTPTPAPTPESPHQHRIEREFRQQICA